MGALRRRSHPVDPIIALITVGGVLFAALVGVAAAEGSAQFGATKLLWVGAAMVGAMIALSSTRAATVVLLLSLAFPFSTQLISGVSLRTTDLLLLLVLTVGIARIGLGWASVPVGLLRWGTLVLAGGAIAGVAGPDIGGSLLREFGGVALPLGAAMMVAATFDRDRDLARMIQACCVALSGASLAAIAQGLGKLPSGLAPQLSPDRVNGLFNHPTILATFLIALMLLLIGVCTQGLRTAGTSPLVIVPTIMLGLVALIETQSRGAVLGLAAGLVVIGGVTVARGRIAPLIALLAVLAGGLFVAIPNVPESQRALLVGRFQKLSQPGAEPGRQRVYAAALKTIEAHPITGVGVLEFGRIERRRNTVPGLEAGLTHAHSIVLEAWLSLGLVGFVAFYAMAAGAVRRLWRATRAGAGSTPLTMGWATGSIAALVGVLVEGSTDMPFWQLEMFTLVLVLIAIGYRMDPQSPATTRSANASDAAR